MDNGNSRQAIGARVLGMFTAANVKWWAAKSREGWIVTSRMVDNYPTETRSGERFTMIVGPFASRRQAEDARAKFSSPQAQRLEAEAAARVAALGVTPADWDWTRKVEPRRQAESAREEFTSPRKGAQS